MEQFYFGRMYAPPPGDFPFIMTIIVVPFSLFPLAAVGAFSTMRQREDRPLDGLFLLGAFASLMIFTSGLSQVFDDGRFMMPVFPYMAAFAGIGFVCTVQAVGRFLSNRRI